MLVLVSIMYYSLNDRQKDNFNIR